MWLAKLTHPSVILLSLPIIVLVAEVTQPSLGVGYEIGRAVDMKKKIFCLFRPQSGRREFRLQENHMLIITLEPSQCNMFMPVK